MNGRRAGAFAIAVALVAGAWLVRTRIIDDPGSSSPPGTTNVICISELADACRAALQGDDTVTLRIESANVTLERRGSAATVEPVVWITMQPFPEMVERLRAIDRLQPVASSTVPLASSPLTLVVAAERATTLAVACGDPVDLRCLGEQAGQPWGDLESGAAGGDVRPAFAPHPATAIGQLGVATAVRGYFGDAPIDDTETGFIVWRKSLSGATSADQLGGLTAINLIQTRASALDIAVGAAAELVDPNDPRFTQLAPDPGLTVEVVAVVDPASAPPDRVVTALKDALLAAGWERPVAGVNGPSADDMLLIRTIWEDLT